MTALYWVRELCGLYVVLTLSSTGLAKLWSLRRASIGVAADRVLPAAAATTVVGTVSVIEVALAVLFVAGAQARLVGSVTAVMFLSFGAYKIAVVARTGLSSCHCTGVTIAYRATRPNVLAAIAVSAVQAAVAFTWAILPAPSNSYFSLIGLVGLSVPIIVLLVGSQSRVGRQRRRTTSSRHGRPHHDSFEPTNR